VLSGLVSTVPPTIAFPGSAGLLTTLSPEYDTSLDAIDDNAFKMQGIKIGHAAATAMLEAREGDGRFEPSTWVQDPASDTGSRSSMQWGRRSSIRPHGWAT
jgi:hypothetical protein